MKRGTTGFTLKDVILGGQDGIVNVAGVVLGIASATSSIRLIIISGLIATFAESISMAAVSYTSSKAAKSYYEKELAKEKGEIKTIPESEKEEIRQIYSKKGFVGRELELIVRKITANKKLWLETMMSEELRLFPDEYASPAKNAAVVGFSSLVGSLLPLIPFLFLTVKYGVIASLLFSVLVLFIVGAVKAKLTIGDWKRSGIEMAIIGLIAAVSGYVIGLLLGRLV